MSRSSSSSSSSSSSAAAAFHAEVFDVLSRVELDLLVVYEGHNDWSQPVFTRGVAQADLWTLSIYRAMAFSWAWSTLHHAGHAMVPRPPGTPTRTHATADDTALDLADAVARAYAAHLTDIVDESPAPVLFTTLLRNFDHPPQGTLAADPAACQAWINDQPKLAEADVDAARAHCGEGALPDWIAAQGQPRATGQRPQLVDLSDPDQPELSLTGLRNLEVPTPATAVRPRGGQ
jgi:hypothetical protein